MNRYSRAIIFLSFSAGSLSFGQLPDGTDVSLGNVLFPHLHTSLAVGDASEDPESLVAGGHDPSNEFSVQGIEPGLSLRMGENLAGFATWNFSYGAEAEWEDEFEEGFLKLQHLPGGVEVRGGRLLNRFGERNAHHLHSWETIDQHLVNGRFLGDDGLIADGADITVPLPIPLTSALTISYGSAPAHAHEEHEDEHREEGGEEEGHEEVEVPGFDGEFVAANLLVKAHRDDFNQFRFSGSLAQGEDEEGEELLLFGLGVNYTWRENGLEAGGRQMSWTTEVMHRDTHPGDELGFYSGAVYTVTPTADAGLRVGYVSGMEEAELEARLRLSPHLTWYPTGQRNLHLRGQYNYDDFEDSGDAHAVWVQLQYSFGGKEVR